MGAERGRRRYTIGEVADLLGLHYNTVQRHIREGVLKATPSPSGRVGMRPDAPRYSISPEGFEEYRRRYVPDPPEREYAGYVFTPEAAALTGYTAAALRESIWHGRIPAWRIQRGPAHWEYLIDLNELYRYMARPKQRGLGRVRREFAVPVSSVPVIPSLDGLPVEQVVPRSERKEQAAA
jgi:excisionase family DNA binding protein